MATPGREDAKFTINVEGVTYTLDLDINAMCLLEEAESTEEKRVTFQDVCARVDKGDFRSIRLIVWAALQRYHQGADVPLAGRVATAVLREHTIVSLMRTVIAGATPAPEDAKALGLEQRNPPKAQARKAGTGPRSTGPRAATG